VSAVERSVVEARRPHVRHDTCGRYTMITAHKFGPGVLRGAPLPEREIDGSLGPALPCDVCHGWFPVSQFHWAEIEMITSRTADESPEGIARYRQAWKDCGPVG
jgi:hypothetical protein